MSRVHYQDFYGAVGFVAEVRKELDHYDKHGRFPGPMAARLFYGTPGATAYLKKMRYIAAIELWSSRLQHDRLRCSECKRKPQRGGGIGPMLHNRVWARIADKDEFLCDQCVRRRLGRPICKHDLIPALWNVNRWRWLDGPRWRAPAPIPFELLPELFWDMPLKDQQLVVKAVQAVVQHFDVRVEHAACALTVMQQRAITRVLGE